jgi:hypothetical protein
MALSRGFRRSRFLRSCEQSEHREGGDISPEARAEADGSVDFYEARLDGLGLRFLATVEETTERISVSPERWCRCLVGLEPLDVTGRSCVPSVPRRD